MTSKLKDKIKNLETSLLQSSTRQSAESLNQLLADDFIEFGVSGKIYNKKDILALLPKEQHSNEIILFDFEMKQLCDDVVHVTYKTKQQEKIVLRSSIWKNNTKHGWKMCFHQGTKIQIDSA